MTDDVYLACSPFEDRDVVYAFYTKKIVTTRKPHPCAVGSNALLRPHVIPVGSRAVRETGKLDGEVVSCYWCFGCLDELEARGCFL
jgi:hypothetical protein